MFRPEGRISLKEVWDALGSDVVERFRKDGQEDDFQSMSEATAGACWDFCRKSATARVVMPIGKLQSLDPLILRTADTDLTYNEHVDLQIGTIGSGKGADQREGSLRRVYGEALFCPVVFTVAEFSKYLRTFGTRPIPEDNSDAAVIQRIIATYQEDPTRNREDIKRIAAETVGVNRYKRLRARAVENVPGLDKGGRKPSKKP
jgi:hypothetical protein